MAVVTDRDRNGGFVRPLSIAESVHERIYERIMSLEIPPGARIPIDGLARELNVSQTPVREALTRLEREGLVQKAHLIGYSASPQLTRKEFDDLYKFRLLLEPESARQACLNLTPETLARIEGAASDMEKGEPPVDRNSRYSRFARADAHFHDEIMKVADNATVRQAMNDQHIHLHIFRLMFHSRVTQEALEEHEHLLAAFRAGDADAAYEAMHDHISRSRDRLVAAFE
ncbi:GntR family transcriptional regulator [Aquicoccus porphyridii]|uniref:GntR family transcriptional regulator n=1 Tax=Aquicoccus porphyridii TaxID=1852029 RepID=A0A5A9ZCT0_9RHOB|nr:GntR family transcriptional regulator [Aquicoccus porphyridii]KAA0914961.1 GntR family transcriptional regulator [Aquicoccus porphyridii]RAI52494.1 GntR family transcriptional regulator [Rhodobacteraceae bacterium AsT-22]